METTLTPLGVSDEEFRTLLVDVIADLARRERRWTADTATTVLEIAEEYGFLSPSAKRSYTRMVNQ